MERYEGAKFETKPSGYVLFDDNEVAHTLQCKHCGDNFISIKGSGKKRGYCHRCNGVLCGKDSCFICIPFAVKLEWVEANGWLKDERTTGETAPIHGIKNEKKIIELLKLYPELANFNMLK